MSSDIQASLAWEKNPLKPDSSKLLKKLCVVYQLWKRSSSQTEGPITFDCEGMGTL